MESSHCRQIQRKRPSGSQLPLSPSCVPKQVGNTRATSRNFVPRCERGQQIFTPYRSACWNRQIMLTWEFLTLRRLVDQIQVVAYLTQALIASTDLLTYAVLARTPKSFSEKEWMTSAFSSWLLTSCHIATFFNPDRPDETFGALLPRSEIQADLLAAFETGRLPKMGDLWQHKGQACMDHGSQAVDAVAASASFAVWLRWRTRQDSRPTVWTRRAEHWQSRSCESPPQRPTCWEEARPKPTFWHWKALSSA